MKKLEDLSQRELIDLVKGLDVGSFEEDEQTRYFKELLDKTKPKPSDFDFFLD